MVPLNDGHLVQLLHTSVNEQCIQCTYSTAQKRLPCVLCRLYWRHMDYINHLDMLGHHSVGLVVDGGGELHHQSVHCSLGARGIYMYNVHVVVKSGLHPYMRTITQCSPNIFSRDIWGQHNSNS